MDEQERTEQDEPRDGAPEETAPEGSATEQESGQAQEQDGGRDAAKLSDEEATLAARAFLGTAEPDEQVSVDEAKKMLRRAGAVAEAEPEIAAPARFPDSGPETGGAHVGTPVTDQRRTPPSARTKNIDTRQHRR